MEPKLKPLYFKPFKMKKFSPDEFENDPESKIPRFLTEYCREYNKTDPLRGLIRDPYSTSRNLYNREHKIISVSYESSRPFYKLKTFGHWNKPILIHGDSGAGKECVAKFAHEEGHRKDGVFLPINCAAISETLIESELFGHIRGAFTGAIKTKDGVIKNADEGILFLDEIDGLSLSAQQKLLRFLQEGEFYKLGESKVSKANVQIVAATNKPLWDMVHNGTFSPDFLHRINGLRVEVPSLKDRHDSDRKALAHYFVLKEIKALDKVKELFIPEEMFYLLWNVQYFGNVREMQMTCAHAVHIAYAYLPLLKDKDSKFATSHTDTLMSEIFHALSPHTIENTLNDYIFPPGYDLSPEIKMSIIYTPHLHDVYGKINSLIKKKSEMDLPNLLAQSMIRASGQGLSYSDLLETKPYQTAKDEITKRFTKHWFEHHISKYPKGMTAKAIAESIGMAESAFSRMKKECGL